MLRLCLRATPVAFATGFAEHWLSEAILAADELQGRRCNPRDELVRAWCSFIWVSSAAVHSWVFAKAKLQMGGGRSYLQILACL